jgi:hypothetical protein
MANVIPDSFKTDLLKGTFNFDSSGGSTFKLALYTDISGLTTSITNNGVAVSSNIAFVDFADLTFSSVTLSAVGALIYKSGGSNEAVLVLDFGGTKTATNGDFVVQFPTASSSAAIIRLGNA